ncbi:cellulose synthase operon protein YhjQ/BcsQ [Actinomyces faecalis]|uniref:cellulose synthase operon protein YhjQ/BcsQ n=1 Tax=Actinomyces faecalis TaxID=2722820 RepID=UPI001556B3CA|nr:cellulose synthase operon protein YhjQ/BcsQ [Actinomyces faecalis]
MTRPSRPAPAVHSTSHRAGQHPGTDEDDRTRGEVVAVVGARGGLGTSCLAVLLARALAVAGQRVALVDADPAGGLGLLMGTGPGPGLRWADLPAQETAFRATRLVDALPTWLGITVLTGDVRGGVEEGRVLEPVLEALSSVHDVVIVDLPRTATPPDGARLVMLTTLDLRSATAVRVLALRAARAGRGPVRLIVLEEGEDVDVDGLVRTTGCQVLGTLAVDRSVAQRTARGDDVTRGRGAARRAARELAGALMREIETRPRVVDR